MDEDWEDLERAPKGKYPPDCALRLSKFRGAKAAARLVFRAGAAERVFAMSSGTTGDKVRVRIAPSGERLRRRRERGL